MLQAQNLSIIIDKSIKLQLARIATSHQYKWRTMIKWHKCWCTMKELKPKHEPQIKFKPNGNDKCNILLEIRANFVDFETHTNCSFIRKKNNFFLCIQFEMVSLCAVTYRKHKFSLHSKFQLQDAIENSNEIIMPNGEKRNTYMNIVKSIFSAHSDTHQSYM